MASILPDEDIFPHFHEIVIGNVLSYFSPANASVVASALKNSETPPAFVYEKVHSLDFVTELANINRVRDLVMKNADDAILQLYNPKLGDLRDTVYKLRAIANGDDERFYLISCEDTGPIDEFAQTATRVRLNQLIDETFGDGRTTVQAARDRLINSVERHSTGQTIVKFLREHDIEFPNQVDVQSEVMLSAEEVRVHFDEYLLKRNLFGYQAEVDVTGNERNFKVKKKSRTIVIPNDDNLQIGRRRPVTPTTVKAFAEHELGVHVTRAVNGNQHLHLLGYGLSGYLNLEECIASYRQALVEGMDDLQKFEHRLASMAIEGTLTGDRMTMAEAYVILRDTLTLREALEVSGEVDPNRIHDLTWTPLLRVCRGTTGVNAGVCYTKDSRQYSNGFPEAYRLLQDKEWAKQAMIGKYDPRKPDHVEPLKTLGVL